MKTTDPEKSQFRIRQSFKYFLQLTFTICLISVGLMDAGIALQEVVAEKFDDCACAPVDCPPCQRSIGLPKFYSSKCGKDGRQVKSCAKVKCEAIVPIPSECQSKEASKAAKNNDNLSSETPEQALYKTHDTTPIKSVGVVTIAVGNTWIYPGGGARKDLKLGEKVMSNDVFETGPNGRLKILFTDKNIITVNPASKLAIAEYVVGGQNGEKKATLDLVYGKVRNIVQQKYSDNKDSYYRVKTPATVAGVRGTDFVTSYDQEVRQTKIETIAGTVHFGTPLSDEGVSVNEGHRATFVEGGETSPELLGLGFLAMKNGTMSPVQTMSSDDIHHLRMSTNWTEETARALLAKEKGSETICSQPRATFNQCSWSCKNNPAGSSRCRTDLENVHCERRRCNANGLWAEETRSPASAISKCDAEKTVVAPCDY